MKYSFLHDLLSVAERVRQVAVATVLVGVWLLATPVATSFDFEGGRPRYSKQEIRRTIHFYAARYRLDPALLRAVIKVESDFRQDAVSRKGAVGLMQLMPASATHLRVTDPYDSIQNIRGGAKQLRHLLNLYEGDLPLALAAYNAGVHRVKGHKVPRIRETRAYVRKVLKYYQAFKPRPPKPRPPRTTKSDLRTRSAPQRTPS